MVEDTVDVAETTAEMGEVSPRAKDIPEADLAGNPSILGPSGSLEELKKNLSKKDKIRKRKLSLTVGKPNKKAWIRCHPDIENFAFEANTIIDENGLDKEHYFLHPTLDGDPVIERDATEQTLVTTCTNRGRIFLWPIPRSENNWSDSARIACKVAREKWVRLIPDLEDGRYSIEESEEAGDPPDWDSLLQGMDMLNLLNLAFGKRFIDDHEHEVLVKLRSVFFESGE